MTYLEWHANMLRLCSKLREARIAGDAEQVTLLRLAIMHAPKVDER